MLYKYIILKATARIGGERTIFSVYHLLQGKSSVQTIQDMHLFHLEALYGIHNSLTKERFMTTIQKNVTEGHLIKINDLNYHISDKGKSWLNRQSDLSTHIFLNGQKYYKTSPVFFKRLQLIIQIWTHAMKEDMQFIPVIDEKEISTWTKAFYRKTKHKAPQYLSQLYDELIKILSVLPDQRPAYLIAQLSSYRFIGQTPLQLAIDYHLTEDDILLETENVLHYILKSVANNRDTYPVLNLLSKFKKGDALHTLNQSTALTKQLFEQGYSIEKLMLKRQLKKSTILDHLIEIAYFDKMFPFGKFYTEDVFHKVTNVIDKLETLQLKKIKATLDNDDITYFQIRLIIAQLHHQKVAMGGHLK